MLCALNNRLQLSNFPPIRYDGQEIRVSDTLRHLGVIFDRQLNFSEHVNSILHCGIKATNILKVAAGREVEEKHLCNVVQEPRPLCCQLRFAYDQHQP